MGQRELTIISQARTVLNDVTEPRRWSTQRLMELLNEAQDAMCKDIPLIAIKGTINTIPGQFEYSLPSNSVKLIRASVEGDPLTICSYEDIEDFDFDWEDSSGPQLTRIVVNSLSQQKIRPYPITSESKIIKFRYHSRATDLGWDNDTEDSINELEISDMWDEGLKQYIIGMAFLDYGDESSTSRAGTAMGLYNTSYSKALKLAKKSFSKRALTTKYQAKVASNLRGDRYGSSCRFGY